MYGVKKDEISFNNGNNEVTIKMPYIGVVWLRGYDKDEECNEVEEVDPNDLPDRFNNLATVV